MILAFLSTLGITFLTIMYEAIDKDKDSVLIVKTNNEKVIGYVAGTSGLGNIYLNLLKKTILFIYGFSTQFIFLY